MNFIENSTKTSLFSQYYNQPVFRNKHWKSSVPNSKMPNFSKLEDWYLVLKPLSQMTDKHSLKVSQILGGASHLSEESQIFQVKDIFCSRKLHMLQTNIHGSSWLKAFQFLQLEGYDLPHFLLEGKTLQESGLAIYEKKS